MNMGLFPFTQYSFDFMATNSTTTVQFGAREDPDYFYFDDANLQAVGGSPGTSGGGFRTHPITDVTLATTLTALNPHSVQGLVGVEVPLASALVNDPRQVTSDQYFASPGEKANAALSLPRTVNTVPGLDLFDPLVDLRNRLGI
jgi:hypothetical protein